VNGLLIDHYRTDSHRREHEIPSGLGNVDGDLALTSVDPHTLTLEDVEFRHDFDLALRNLDEDQRDAFIVTELRGLTEREAADVLDTSQPTVHRRAEAARNQLREEIAA